MKVSVIIPTYNYAHGIMRTIDCVLAQTLGNLELLIVDDGSSDNTEAVISSIEDQRVRYIHQANSGVPRARNAGLAEAAGEYVAFLDHDDLWPEDFLEIMVAELDTNPEYGLVYSPITKRYDDGQEVRSYKRPEGKSGYLTSELFSRGFIWTSACVIRRSLLRDFGYDESLTRSYEDGDFYLRLSVRGKFLFTDKTEAIRIEHDNNLSAKVGVMPTRVKVLERFYLENGGKDLVPQEVAYRKLSHACRKVFKASLQEGQFEQAGVFLKKALGYRPYDVRLWLDFVRLLHCKITGVESDIDTAKRGGS